MQMIGLAGSAGTGKDTVADYLVSQYGFTKFSFSDALYREVSEAFGVSIEELQNRGKKEIPHHQLTPTDCKSRDFYLVMMRYGIHPYQPVSPRWVLQHWGTEYRRAQDPDYWLKQASLWVQAWLQVTEDDGEYHAGLVNTSVRFPNEQAWVAAMQGTVWHVRRGDCAGNASQLDHAAEQPLPMNKGDRELFNNGTVEQLHTAVSLLLQAPFKEDPNLVVDAMFDKPAFAVCASCGQLHLAYTEAQAQDEVDTYMQSRSWSFDDDDEHNITVAPVVTLDDYRNCDVCGSSSFSSVTLDVAQDVAEQMDLVPVIFEGNNNGK